MTITVENNKIIIHVNDLWLELKERARKMKKIDVDSLERELDEAEEEWIQRIDM